MKKDITLELAKAEKYRDDYGYDRERIYKINVDEVIENIWRGVIKGSIDRYCFTTLIENNLFTKKHILAYDCDSKLDLDKSFLCLESLGLKCIVIESSPGRYWVITNFIGSFKEVIYKYFF